MISGPDRMSLCDRKRPLEEESVKRKNDEWQRWYEQRPPAVFRRVVELDFNVNERQQIQQLLVEYHVLDRPRPQEELFFDCKNLSESEILRLSSASEVLTRMSWMLYFNEDLYKELDDGSDLERRQHNFRQLSAAARDAGRYVMLADGHKLVSAGTI